MSTAGSGQSISGPSRLVQSNRIALTKGESPKVTVNPSLDVSKKQKRHSPFRIKAGCIVALRYRPGGNKLTLVSPADNPVENESEISRQLNSFAEVWTDPFPGRDEGLALIGRRVRCCFPKSVGGNRFVEGEIIRLIDYEAEWLVRREQRRRRKARGIKVELLVDQDVLASRPFLERIGEDAAESAETLSSSEKKRRRLEDLIRGENKVSVKVTLEDIFKIHAKKGNDVKSDELIAKWVIRKRIAVPTSGATWDSMGTVAATPEETNGDDTEKDSAEKKKRRKRKADSDSATRYLGDGNDPAEQQERNFRWFAGRLDDMRLRRGPYFPDKFSQVQGLSLGFIGEVLSVAPCASPSSGSLAMVTMRRLALPEHSLSGRMSYHGPNDLFDDGDCNAAKLSAHVVEAGSIFQIPVEEVVIVHRRFQRGRPSQNGSAVPNVPNISRMYSLKNDLYRETSQSHLNGALDNGDTPSITTDEDTNADKPRVDICHRCRKTTTMVTKKRLTSKHINGEIIKSGCFCEPCFKAIKLLGKEKSGSRFGLPCDCRACAAGADETLQESLAQSVAKAHAAISGEDESFNDQSSNICSVCANVCRSGVCCTTCGDCFHVQCYLWDKSLARGNNTSLDLKKSEKPIICRCCQRANTVPITGGSDVESTINATRIMRATDFALPDALLNLKKQPIPATKPITKIKKSRKTPKKSTRVTPTGGIEVVAASDVNTVKDIAHANDSAEKVKSKEEDTFEASCSRLIPYDPSKKKRLSSVPKSSRDDAVDSESMTDNAPLRSDVGTLRQTHKRSRDPAKGKKKAVGRAARANQRRMMRDVAAMGASGLGLDALVGRDQQLRFDRSSIHAWGVFADEAINAGDMVVEYRGELIGNALAEKREKEYELAKIGSDYMFRIDAYTVCDATKQGNVARFINASCDPNCYTQIVTLSGTKRIVIYAKKDIQVGEELCYDYKFPFEFDETKRIECHCGAQSCRGYMNWDKKYVALPPGASQQQQLRGDKKET